MDSQQALPGWERETKPSARSGCFAWTTVALAGALGLGLLADSLFRSSATYDESAYLRVAAHWWRTGDQEAITRMGSPLSFWKLQQIPVLWSLDRAGYGWVVDDPERYQAILLPLIRLSSLWIWLVAFLLTTAWSRQLYGKRAMALAAALFALSPNLLAHGALATMELPIVACSAGLFLLFHQFLRGGRAPWFWATAALAGLSWSCKFTTALVVAILAFSWWLDCLRAEGRGRSFAESTIRVARGMVGFVLVMGLVNALVTGFALEPMSEQAGRHPTLATRVGETWQPLADRWVETPLPADWVGFATQMRHQASGGPSYLLGERRVNGWWYYYFIALAVKLPPALWLLLVARGVMGRRSSADGLILTSIAAFLAVTAVCSSRNYGFRYLLPMAPLAIVWLSALAEGKWPMRAIAWLGVLAQAVAVASVHPYELSYFNSLAGGTAGGRRILSDSNLDWGQGLRALVRLQHARPELRDLTLYYFGDTRPEYYGVSGVCHVIDAGEAHRGLPARFSANTTYVGVSTSLGWGPWGPPGYFHCLDGVAPAAVTEDGTITVYKVRDIAFGEHRSSVDRGRSSLHVVRSRTELGAAGRAEFRAGRHRLAALGAELGARR
jgi:hypothetical protein